MQPSPQNRAVEFEKLLAEALQKAGLHVNKSSGSADRGVDIVARQGKKIYVFELKVSSESRKDRAIPLISQGILEVQQAAANAFRGAIPVVVFASDYVSDSLAEHVEEFASRNAPHVGIGVIDRGGFRRFSGHGLEVLNAERSPSRSLNRIRKGASAGNLFSDLNQWMLKILLSRSIPEPLLSAPRGHYENASQLADAAGVSIMSAFRLVRQLSEEGFLDERGGLRLVRIEELLERWLRASPYRVHEIPARWILRGEKNAFHAALRSYTSRMRSDAPVSERNHVRKASPRICLALFAAAEVLGFKFVHGTQPHIYIENLDEEALRQLGLSVESANHQPDVSVRIPENPHAVFRAAVERNGVPAADVLQVWLDVAHHPARGKAQADILRKQIFSRFFDKDYA